MKAEVRTLEEIVKIIPGSSVISIAGAGGKTTLMFRLSRMLPGKTMTTTTTKVGADQIMSAERQLTIEEFPLIGSVKSVWISPSLQPVNGKIAGCNLQEFSKLVYLCRKNGFTLINEADGASRRHIKAPAEHEPVIPPETGVCIYLAGLDVLGSTVNESNVHRPELFSSVTGTGIGCKIDAESIIRLFDHPKGGLKNFPDSTLRIAYFTHADTTERIKAGQYIADSLINYDIICISK